MVTRKQRKFGELIADWCRGQGRTKETYDCGRREGWEAFAREVRDWAECDAPLATHCRAIFVAKIVGKIDALLQRGPKGETRESTCQFCKGTGRAMQYGFITGEKRGERRCPKCSGSGKAKT